MSSTQRYNPGEAVVEVPIKSTGCVILEFGTTNNRGAAGFSEIFPSNLPEALMSLPDWTMFIQGV